MSTVSELFRRICTCCYKPAVGDSSELPQGEQATGIQDPQGLLSQNSPLTQEQIHSVPWKGTSSSPVDMTNIPDCGSVVKRPEDVDQSELHHVPWKDVGKGSEEWGGERSNPTGEWATNKTSEEEATDDLPLPWEALFRQGPVPFDGKTIGPSWRETPVQNIIKELEAQIPDVEPAQLEKLIQANKSNQANRTTKEAQVSDDGSNSQNSSKSKTSKDKSSSNDSPDSTKAIATQEKPTISQEEPSLENLVTAQETSTASQKNPTVSQKISIFSQEESTTGKEKTSSDISDPTVGSKAKTKLTSIHDK